MLNTFFSGVSSLSSIPIQNLVRVTKGNPATSVATTTSGFEVPLIYDEDSFTVKAKSDFGNLADPSSNPLMTLLSGFTGGAIPSGQFAMQSVQIWKSTDPLEISVTVKLYMRDSGYDDVVTPIKKLMKLSLPTTGENGLLTDLGSLVPPGPTLKTLIDLTGFQELSEFVQTHFGGQSGGLVNVDVGKFHFSNCILTEVTPEFSTTVDEDGYPVSASVSLELRTCMIATGGMIDSIFRRS